MIPELTSLLEAEIHYAHFNARRTSVNASDDAISKSSINGVSQVRDSSRPQNEYYNRAVVHPVVTSVAVVLRHIPASVEAIELLFPQQTEENFACLPDNGFTPATSLCYLAATPNEMRSPECTVVQFQPYPRDVFFDLLEQSGASFPQEKRNATQQFYCTEEFRCLVAFNADDQPAGWATMYIEGGTAFFANAFTLPEQRGTGVHAALLNTRLTLANHLGLTHAFTDVEPASQSHRNCERSGFRLLSVNSIWKRNRNESDNECVNRSGESGGI